MFQGEVVASLLAGMDSGASYGEVGGASSFGLGTPVGYGEAQRG